MDNESRAQFILNMAKELVLSGKYPVPKRGFIISSKMFLPKIETTQETIEDRQQKFLNGYRKLVNMIDSLYKELLVDPVMAENISQKLEEIIGENISSKREKEKKQNRTNVKNKNQRRTKQKNAPINQPKNKKKKKKK